jgi:DnaJ homolog subfamily C member 28
MTNSKREKRQRLENLEPKLNEYQTPDTPWRTSRLPRKEEERQGLIERLIREAMAEGAFDDLPGKGKPLIFDTNPYLEPGQELAFGLLKRNGYAPEWIERDKAIRRELDAARAYLRRAWQAWIDEAAWQAAVTRFAERLARLNRQIDDFNLTVPVVSCQRSRLRLVDEIQRAQQDTPEEDDRNE